jgi:hypothetical protein
MAKRVILTDSFTHKFSLYKKNIAGNTGVKVIFYQ